MPALIRLARVAALVATVTLVALASKNARADETDVCLESHVSAQQARKEGSTLVAYLALQRCEKETCPSRVREECAMWKRELESILGSIAVDLQVSPGRDATRATVKIDGADPLVPLGGGKYLTTVGKHVVEAGMEGEPRSRVEVMVPPAGTVSAQIDLREEAAAPVLPAPVVQPTSEGSPGPSPLTIAGAVLTGLGGAGLITFAVAGGLGMGAYGDLDACRPGCPQSQVDDVDNKFLVADIGLGAGLGLAAVGAVLLIVGEVQRPDDATQKTSFFPGFQF